MTGLLKIKDLLKKTFLYKIYRKRLVEQHDLMLKQNEILYLNSLKETSSNKYKVYDEPPIEVINLNANDICNSKCVMCNIWEQKKEKEITTDDLKKILDLNVP